MAREVRLVLKNTNADTFVNWLTGYVEAMNDRCFSSEKGGRLFTEVDSNLDDWIYREPGDGFPGWIYRVVALVDLPGGPPDGDLESGYYPFEITPLRYPFHQAGVEVAVKRHPAEEHDRTKAYLLELLNAIAQRWEGTAEQLSAQGLILGDESLGVGILSERSETEAHPPIGVSASGEEAVMSGSSVDAPWKQIPDILYNRQMLKLWCEGYTAAEIGRRLSKAPKTITNRLSELRRNYGEEIVPRRK